MIDPKELLILIAIALIVWVADEVKTGLHKAGCKVHLVRAEHCQAKPAPPSGVVVP